MRKVEELDAQYKMAEDSLARLKDAYMKMDASFSKMKNEFNKLQKDSRQLAKDTSLMGQQNRNIEKLNTQLNELYEKVIQQNKDLLNTSAQEKQKLSVELGEKERALIEKQKELTDRESEIDRKNNELEGLQYSLKQREEKVKELTEALDKQSQILSTIKQNISSALTSYSGSDLQVEEKDGKLYISLSEKLLFGSGSTSIDARGKQAVASIAEVLKNDSSIDIIVEGHTDNVPYNGSGKVTDNWDLSVLRATVITRLLVKNGVEENQVVASGKGEFMPKASNDTKEGRALNRRTEIIISPNLDELLNMLDQ